eukprot:55361-Eustigmatos_ZCMA.PRE.2
MPAHKSYVSWKSSPRAAMDGVLQALIDGGAAKLTHLVLRGGVSVAKGVMETGSGAGHSGHWRRLEVLEMGPVVMVGDAWGRLLQDIALRTFIAAASTVGAASVGLKTLGMGLINLGEPA